MTTGRIRHAFRITEWGLLTTWIILNVTALPAAPGQSLKLSVQAMRLIAGPKNEPFNMPSDCAVGADGTLYVLDGVHNRVVVYDKENTYRFQFGHQGSDLGQFNFPLGIASAPDGRIFVADSGNHRFQIFSADGTPLQAVPLPIKSADELPPDPTDVAIHPDGTRLYIVDNDNHRLNVYDMIQQRFVDVWGEPGQGRRQFRFPFLLDISDQGYLVVVEPINTRVQVLNDQGKFVNFIGNWGTKPGQLFRPKGAAVWKDRVFVTDSYLGRIQIYDMRGNFIGILNGPDGMPLKLTTPTGIAADVPNKRLYVVELKANQVARLDLE